MLTVTEILDNTVQLYGKCPGCGEFHCDVEKIVEYFQWLSDQSLINFN